MATKKKAAKKAKSKPRKKPFAGGDDPIVVGGGSGLLIKPRKNAKAVLCAGTCIEFNPGWYKRENPRKPREHRHLGDKLGGLLFKSGGGTTSTNVGPDDNLVIFCRRPPSPSSNPVVWINGKDMTFDFTDDFVQERPGHWRCGYFKITEVRVESSPVFTSVDGDCAVEADNTL